MAGANVGGAGANPQETWAVVVVHGVGGGGQPGSTLTEFLKPLLNANPDAVQTEPPEVRMLRPAAVAGEKRAQRFPAHFREYAFPSARPGTPQKAVFAEVFWGDLSATRDGTLQVLARLFTMVFDISFVADQAAAFYGLLLVPLFRFGLYSISWLLCGPIAAFNAVFLYLLTVHYVDGLLRSSQGMLLGGLGPKLLPWEIGVLGVLLTAVGWVYARVSSWRIQIAPRWNPGWLRGARVAMAFGLLFLGLFAWLLLQDEERIQGGIDSFVADFLPWWALLLGSMLAVLSAGSLFVSWARQWGFRRLLRLLFWRLARTSRPGQPARNLLARPWLEAWDFLGRLLRVARSWTRRRSSFRLLAHVAGTCAGIGIVVCFATAAVAVALGRDLHQTLPHTQMLGCGVAAFLFSGALWVWGSFRKVPWNSVWLLLHLATFLFASTSLTGLAAYRLAVPAEEYNQSWLAQRVAERVPLAIAHASTFASYLAVLIFAIRAWFFGLGIVTCATAVVWLLTHLECGVRTLADLRWPFRQVPKGHYPPAHPGLAAAFGVTLLQVGLWVLIVPALGAIAVQRLAPELVEVGTWTQSALGAVQGAPAVLWPAVAVGPVGVLGPLTLYNSHLLSTVWTQFAFHTLLALVVLLATLARWAWRWFWVHRKFHGAVAPLPVARQIARFLASWWFILFPLIVLSLVGSVQSSLSFWDAQPKLPAALLQGLQDNGPRVVAGAVAVFTLVFLLFRKGLLAALHVATDVISHFHRPRQQNPWKYPGPTLEARELDEFRVQRRIEARAYRVLQEVLGDETITRLTVVAHSQGTVIAIHTLYQGSTLRLFQASRLTNRRACLITMGSPFTHLYQHYIPRRYPPLFVNGQFNTGGWYALEHTVEPWLNVFRVDDFIGTHIDSEGNGFPQDSVLEKAGGHTTYWANEEAFAAIRAELPGA